MIGFQHLHPRHRDRGKGLVYLVKIDVADVHAGALQRLLCGADRSFQHDHRIFTHHRHGVDAGQRLDAQRLQPTFVDDQHARCTVADLAAGRRRESAAFRVDQLHTAHTFQADIKTDAFVLGMDVRRAIMRRHVDRHDFGIERARFGRTGAAHLAFIAKFVEHVLGQPIFGGDHFGAGELAELDAGVARGHGIAIGHAHAGLGGQRHGHAHRHAGHRFDAGGNHHVHLAAHHRGGSKMDGLLAGAALAVDAGARHRFRQL